jgi:T5SS/PEP-CTERM-associated repeat protein
MATYYWYRVGANGDFSDSHHWETDQMVTPSGPPGGGDTAVIEAGMVTGSGGVGELYIIGMEYGGGNLTADTKIVTGGLLVASGSVNAGELDIDVGGGVEVDGGDLTADTAVVDGTLTVASGNVNFTAYAVGLYGTMNLTIQNKAQVTTTDASLYSGSSLDIEQGGELKCTGGQNSVPANGAVGATIDGMATINGGTLDSSGGWISVGEAGTGVLDANNGASITSTYLAISTNAGDSGAVTLEGSGTLWTLTSQVPQYYLFVGSRGTGTLSISDGAALDAAGACTIGYHAGGSGTVTVTGNGSKLSIGTFLIVGVSGAGTLTLENGASMTTGGTTEDTLEGVYIGYNSGGTGTFTIEGAGTQLTNTGQIVVGYQGTGTFTVTDSAKVTTSINGNPQEPGLLVGAGGIDAGDSGTGTGTVMVSGGATLDASKSDVAIGEDGTGSADTSPSDFGMGTVTVDGSGSTLEADNITVGGLTPTAPPADDGSDETGDDWTYSGGVGTLTVSNDGAVTVAGNLKLQDDVKTGTDAAQTAEGGVYIQSGGGINVGGSAVAPADTLAIAENAFLVGHGLITGTVTGEVPVSDSTTTPTYSLAIENNGTIEADEGNLVLDGNLSGDGKVLLGANSTLELGGTVADSVTIKFLPGGNEKIVIDDPMDFNGVISSENFEPGDQIDLPNVPYVNPGANDLNPDGASFYFETGEGQQNYVLQVVENDQTYDVPISEDDQQFSGGFTLSDDGNGGTLVTRTANAVTGYSETATADDKVVDPYSGIVSIQTYFKVLGFNTGIVNTHGTGFAIGRNLILTAEHVVYGLTTVYVKVNYGEFSRELKGYVLPYSGTIPNPDRLSPIGSLGDYAFVYVPGADFSEVNQFGLDRNFSFYAVKTAEAGNLPELFNQTGYPGNFNTTEQYNIIEPVTGSSGIIYYGIPLSHGYSGGPLWGYANGNFSAVRIASSSSWALNVSGIPIAAENAAEATAARNFIRDPPGITSAVLLQTGDADTGQTVQFLLSMSENVTVTGSGPALSLNDGGTATYDAANSTGTELEFDYTVAAGDRTSNLEITQVNGAQTVQAPGGASIDFPVLDNQPTDLSINSPLVVTSIASSQTGEVGAGASVQLILAMNGPVSINLAGGAPTLLLNDNETATYDAASLEPVRRQACVRLHDRRRGDPEPGNKFRQSSNGNDGDGRRRLQRGFLRGHRRTDRPSGWPSLYYRDRLVTERRPCRR